MNNKDSIEKSERMIDKLFSDDHAQMFVLIGKSFKGKSYFMRFLITDRMVNAGWKFGLVFCKTKFNHDYDFLPEDKVYEGYNEEILEKYIDNLKKVLEKKGPGSVPPNFIIFDDLIGVINNQTDYFSNFMSTFRHTNTNILLAVQYLTGKNAVSPFMREQTNYAIIFKSTTFNTLDNLYRSYGGIFEKFQDFKDHFKKATDEKYAAMLYSEKIDDLEDNYITIQAPADYKKIKFKF